MDLGISGRRALVAGASSGLGLACARALAAEGVSVAMASRSQERIEAAATSILDDVASRSESDVDEAEPGADRTIRVVPLVADVSSPDGATGLVAAAIEELGGVDIVITNAGGPARGGFDEVDVDAYYEAVELNMLSTIAMVKAAVADMRPRGWGRIVAITSATVREPRSDLILSNTARAGATAFLKTAATAVAPDGITINSLQPGSHLTPRLESFSSDLDSVAAAIPTGELGRPDDFGRVAAFLCSDSARFITGAALPLDGGALSGLQ